MNIFEEAARKALRFPSVQGQLTVEDLFRLPLTSTRANTASLDAVAKGVNKELKNSEEESFVTTASTANKTLQLQLDILKHIIADKKAENEAASQARANAERKNRIAEILASKKEDALKGLSVEELEAQYAAL